MLGIAAIQKAVFRYQAMKALEAPQAIIPLQTPKHPNPEQVIRDMLPCNLD